MLLNNLQIALRNLLRNRVFSVINIVGLAAGIMCTVALFLYVADELSYDRYGGNPANVYRAFIRMDLNGRESVSAKTAAATGKVLQQSFPEVLEYARIGYQGEHILRYGDKVFRENNIYLADGSYFSMLAAPLLYGDQGRALSQPNSIVLTEASAKKYFGEENPMGKTLQVDEKTTWQVTGVLKDVGEKSHFDCDFLIPMPEEIRNDNGHWFDLAFTSYLRLKDGVDIKDFEKKIRKKVNEGVAPEAEALLGVPADKFLAAGNTYRLSFQPLSSVYLYSHRKYGIDPNTEWGNARTSDIIYVYIFSAAALFILLIAVMNFVNLSTATSAKRSKEVGIRKTLGSNHHSLIGQFMAEAILITFIAVVVALILLEFTLPFFNGLSGKDLQLDFSNFYVIPCLLVFTVLVGAIAGSYPAFYLSSFKPVTVLKEGPPKRKATLRSVLVVTQFAISSILLIGVIAIRKQVDYIQNKDLGFRREFLVSIANGAVLAGKEKTFKEELLKNPAITSVTNASLMFASGIPGGGYLYDKTVGADPLLFQYLDVDADFMKTLDLKLKEGRFFSDKLSTDSQAVVINEAAARECNIHSPVNHNLTRIGSKTYRIIGVLKDFNYESLRQKVRPLVLHLSRVNQPASIFTIRVKSTGLTNSVKYIEDSWDKFAGNEKCYLIFLDQYLKRMYDSEKKTETIVLVFSFIAVLIACLGLFGLTAFVTEQKKKEIGIRKVLGATVSGILIHISRQYILLIILGNGLSWPIAWIIVNRWFSGFAYHTSIGLYIFLVSALLMFFIAIATICLQALRAAKANPVKSLRTE